MEESSNGKVEVIQKVESQEEDKEVVIEDTGELKTEAESVREIFINGNSDSMKEKQDRDDSSSNSSSSDEEAEPNNEKSVQVQDCGELEEEIIVNDLVVDLVEPEVPLSEDAAEVPDEILEASVDVAEPESKEIEGKLSESLEESNGISADETNAESKEIEEATLPSTDVIETEVLSKGIEEIILPSPKENGEVSVATTDVVTNAIEETKLPALEQNTGESSGTADLECQEKVVEASQEVANAETVDTTKTSENANKPDQTIPASTGNPPIISLNQRTLRPTSWRSCCGLLDVLRRSDR